MKAIAPSAKRDTQKQTPAGAAEFSSLRRLETRAAPPSRARTLKRMTDAPLVATPLTHDSRVRSYDLGAWFYDWVVGSALYHRIAWGMHPEEHARFTERALHHAPEGDVLDAGCGGLLFTAPTYCRTARSLTLFDGSQGMLARARGRLGPSAHEPRIQLRHGDLYAPPFTTAQFASVSHFGVLHCLDRPERCLSELARITRPGGTLFLSCLVLARPRGDAFLARLHRAGHIAPARTLTEVQTLVTQARYTITAAQTRGSFLFLEARVGKFRQ